MSLELIMLFIDGHPMVYEVKKKGKSFSFTPITSWKDSLEAAPFTLEKVEGKWEVTGIQDKNVIDQAIEELEKRPF